MNVMIPLWIGLALGLGLVLALGALAYLLLRLPRRVMDLVVDERAAAETAQTENAALKQATAVEVAAIVRELRRYDEHAARRTRAAEEQVARMVAHGYALVLWLQAFAEAQHAARPVDRNAPTARATALASPGSAPAQPPAPAHVVSVAPPTPGAAEGTPLRTAPRPAGASPATPRTPPGRPAFGSAPTLLSPAAPLAPPAAGGTG